MIRIELARGGCRASGLCANHQARRRRRSQALQLGELLGLVCIRVSSGFGDRQAPVESIAFAEGPFGSRYSSVAPISSAALRTSLRSRGLRAARRVLRRDHRATSRLRSIAALCLRGRPASNRGSRAVRRALPLLRIECRQGQFEFVIVVAQGRHRTARFDAPCPRHRLRARPADRRRAGGFRCA